MILDCLVRRDFCSQQGCSLSKLWDWYFMNRSLKPGQGLGSLKNILPWQVGGDFSSFQPDRLELALNVAVGWKGMAREWTIILHYHATIGSWWKDLMLFLHHHPLIDFLSYWYRGQDPGLEISNTAGASSANVALSSAYWWQSFYSSPAAIVL